MKKIISTITLTIVFMLMVSFTAFSGQVEKITSFNANATRNSVNVSGTVGSASTIAVTVQVLDGDSILAMESFVVSDNSFSGVINDMVLLAGHSYTVRAADYDGGNWFTTTATVPTESEPSYHSSGNTFKTYTPGWIQDSKGWWYRYADGRWPANCWAQLPWKNGYEWYHFNAEGYMQTGWFTDTDGHRYFLWNVSDDSMGRMLYGPQIIGGVPYNFNAVHNGYFGALIP